MDTNIGKAIIGTFLILLGIPGILFALVFFFFGENELSVRIIFLAIAGFIPLIFLIFGLKLLLPIVFKESKDIKKKTESIQQKIEKDGINETIGRLVEIGVGLFYVVIGLILFLATYHESNRFISFLGIIVSIIIVVYGIRFFFRGGSSQDSGWVGADTDGGD